MDNDRERNRQGSEHRRSPASFVIVLWAEPQGMAIEPEWRWRVRSAQTGDETHFHRVAELLAYVAGETGLREPR